MQPDLTDRQLDMMNILWEEGPSTVREAKEELDEELAYTSVLTVFQTLEAHGQVDHEQEGRAYRYYPTISREVAGQKAVDYVLRRVCNGSPSMLLSALASQEEVPDRMAEEIRALVN